MRPSGSLLTLSSALLALAAVACAGSSAPPPADEDSGTTRRRDSGRREDPNCGIVGNECCFESPRCEGGQNEAICGSNGECCAVPDGARCSRSSDCCGDAVCSGTRCCLPEGKRCETDRECCDGECLDSTGRCGTLDCEFRECDDCLANGCGWCGDDSACVEGTSDGPSSGTCADRDWFFGSAGRCPSTTEECSASRCGDCLDSGGSCGWCGRSVSSGQCEPGDTSDADDGCGSTWSWTETDCEQLDTSCAADDCGSCLDLRGCGWCNSTGECQSEEGLCTDWADTDAECTDPCPETNCDACIHDSCGWCGSSNECVEGSESGPDGSSCSDWVWRSAECGGSSEDCTSANDCAECNSRIGCNWCSDDNRCVSDATAVDAGCSRGGWRDSAAMCCENAASCGTCDTIDGCGWCDRNNECLEGGTSGAEDGSCSGTSWIGEGESCDGGTDPDCNPVQGSCSVSSDCCDTASQNLTCREGQSFPRRCCAEADSSCSVSSDCCGWMICFDNQCQCRDADLNCLDDRDCCSNDCGTDGLCN